MIEINLIPDVKRELLKAQRARVVVISTAIMTSIVAVGVLVLISAYVFGVQAARESSLDKQIKEKSSQLAQIDDLSEVLTIQHQLATISGLNDKKIVTSRVFDVISAITPQGDSAVSFSQITVTPTEETQDESITTAAAAGGKIQLEGQTQSYEAMEAFKKRILNTSFQYKEGDDDVLIPLTANVSTGEISYGEDASGNKVLRFTLTFEYPPELLSSKTIDQQLSYKLTVDGNVTDSYIGIPRFTERASDIEGGQ